MTAVSIVLSILALQAPAVDRSAEPTLRKLMDDCNAVRNVRYRVSTYTRETSRDPFYPAGDFILQIGKPGVFRYEFMDMWGDGRMCISNGKTMLVDGLSTGEPAYLRKAPESIFEAGAEMKPKGDRYSPMFYLVHGSGALDQLAAKDKPITELPPENGRRRVTAFNADAGTLTFYFREEKGKFAIEQVEFDNIPYIKDLHQRFPEWVDEPADPLTRHIVSSSPLQGRRGLFDPKPPKGREVVDQTKATVPPQV